MNKTIITYKVVVNYYDSGDVVYKNLTFSQLVVLLQDAEIVDTAYSIIITTILPLTMGTRG